MKSREAHLVMLNYYYPPMKSPGVTRNYYFSNSFLKSFQSVSVFTTSNRNILSQDTNFTIPQSITINEVKTSDYRTWTSSKTKENTIHFDDKKKQSLGAKFAIKLIDTFPFNVILGEGGFRYSWNAYFAIKRHIKQYPNTVIYASFRPYSDLFVAYLIKRSHPHIKWIADFRDLHVEPIYKNVLLPKSQIWWNKKMLKKADLITSVSEGLVQQLNKYKRPTHALINGVTIRPEQPYFDKFTISYTGSLFNNERDPSFLFTALQQLLNQGTMTPDNFQIVYAGRDGAKFQQLINKYGLSDLFMNLNMVTRKKALSIQSKSHINLLLSVNSEEHKGVLTGKLFEYLGALNSILLIMIGRYDDEFEQLFKNCDAGKIYYTETSSISDISTYISSSIKDWQVAIAPSKLNAHAVQSSFSWDRSVSSLLDQLYAD